MGVPEADLPKAVLPRGQFRGVRRRLLSAAINAPPVTSTIDDGSGTVCTLYKTVGVKVDPFAKVSVAVKPTKFCGLKDVLSVLITRICDVSFAAPTGIPGEKSKLTTSPSGPRSAPDGAWYPG